MTIFVARRLLGGLVQLVIVTLLAWILFYVIARFTGASPALRAAGRNPTPERIAQAEKLLGTDKPYWQQYVSFLSGILHGDFGYSFNQRRPVSDIIYPAAAATASVVIGAAVMWMLIAVPIGIATCLRPQRWPS